MNPLPGDLFARRLRQERERLSISQAELARRIAKILGINVDPSAVTRIEQQTRAVRLDEAVAAAEALDLPLTLLLSDDPAAESEARLQQYIAELALAQREWEKNRLEVQRLFRAIQALTGGADPQTLLDPRLRDAIDARVPAESSEDDKITSPDPGPGA
ncbi:helix-turn-helix domain-containing protein [Saccharopolyspora shandongensis]|uniref:helix-turn-helix domain-containing protein n=1 Tax=Saccharopolyspora shandongensis TaxID=418495 RepID=UPI0033DD0BBD